jgi:hypothetical protein
MALDPNIALGVRGIEVANPLAQYAQVAQIQSLQNQNQVSQMQLDQMRRDEATLQQIQAKAVEHGGPADLGQIADAYLKSGNPKFVEFGVGLRQKLDERAQFANIMGMGKTPTPVAPVANAMTAPMQAGALGSGTFGMTPEPVNRLAPAPAAPAPVANALAVPDVSNLRAKRDALLAMGTPQAIAAARAMDADIALAARRPVLHTVNGRLVSDTGGVVYEAPPETNDIKEYEYAKKNQGFKGSFTDFMQIKPIAGAARQVTNVNTQIPASEEAQKEFMKEARVTYNTLKNAPSVLSNMEDAKKLIPSAKGFMGPGGEPLLKAASFLNNRLGTSIDTQGIEDATVLRSRLFNGVIENLRKLDAQPTQAQQQVLQDAIGNLGTDPSALPRVLDAFGGILKDKVNAYNAEVTDAESRGVKFPYKPQINIPSARPSGADLIPGQGAAPAPAIPQGAIDALKAGKGTDAQFDAIFGAGAAKRARGGR